MSSQTTNLHLVKPTSADTADIGIINGNMDIIDAAVGTINDDIDSISETVAGKTDMTAMGARFTIPAAAEQIFQISFTCKNAGNSHNGHAMTFVIRDSGMFLWDNSTSSTVWSK